MESVSQTSVVEKRMRRTLKAYGRFTIPEKLLRQAKRREVTVVLDDMRYVFETDKYGRIYLPPELRVKIAYMASVTIGLEDGDVVMRFRRF